MFAPLHNIPPIGSVCPRCVERVKLAHHILLKHPWLTRGELVNRLLDKHPVWTIDGAPEAVERLEDWGYVRTVHGATTSGADTFQMIRPVWLGQPEWAKGTQLPSTVATTVLTDNREISDALGELAGLAVGAR